MDPAGIIIRVDLVISMCCHVVMRMVLAKEKIFACELCQEPFII